MRVITSFYRCNPQANSDLFTHHPLITSFYRWNPQANSYLFTPHPLITSFYLFHPQSNCTYLYPLIISSPRIYSFNPQAKSYIPRSPQFTISPLRPICIHSLITSFYSNFSNFSPIVHIFTPHHLITSFYSFNSQAKSYIPRSPQSISPLRPICIHPSSLLTSFYVFPHQLFNYSPLKA